MAAVDIGVGDKIPHLDRNPLAGCVQVLQLAVQRQAVDLHAQLRSGLIIAGTKLGPLQHQRRVFLAGTVAARGHRRTIVVDDGTDAVLTAHGHGQGFIRFDQTIVHRRDGHGKARHPGRHGDLAGGAVVGHPVAELGSPPVKAGSRVGTAALDAEVILGRFLGRIRERHRVQQVATLGRTLAGDRLYDGRKQRLGCERAQAVVAVAIHHLDLEVDVAISQRLGHVLILEELPLAGGRGKFQTEHQGAIACLADQSIGRFHRGGNQLAGRRGQPGLGRTDQLHVALAVGPPLRSDRAGTVGDGRRRGGTEELDALHGEVTVVGIEAVTIVGGLDDHGIEATLLYLEVAGIVATRRVGAEGLGTDQHAAAVELDHAALQLATEHLAELDVGTIGYLACIQLDDQLLRSRSTVCKVAEVHLVGKVVVR